MSLRLSQPRRAKSCPRIYLEPSPLHISAPLNLKLLKDEELAIILGLATDWKDHYYGD
jgi:hypothetical protein